MERSDLREVTAIEVKSFSDPWTEDMFIHEMEIGFSVPLIFHFDGKPVGYLCWWRVVEEAQLLNIAVHPQHRRNGFGQALMGKLESLCGEEGIHRVILEVARTNAAARALYRKCGYQVIGFRKRYYHETGDDAFVMEKFLHSRDISPAPPPGGVP